MKIIYACFGGAHSSVTAAAIHLGALPAAGRPPVASIRGLPLFDRQTSAGLGRLHLVGEDRWGNEVYVLGRGPLRSPFVDLLPAAARAMGGDEVLAVDTVFLINWAMVLGGILSRRLGLVWPGRWLVGWGTWFAYPLLVRLVRQVMYRAQEKTPAAAQDGHPGAVFCCCQTGRHASLVLAYRLTGRLGEGAGRRELLALPGFGLPGPVPSLQPAGRDAAGRAVYAVGTGPCHRLAARVLCELARVLGREEQVAVLDVAPANSPMVCVSQWLARHGFPAARGLAARSLAASRRARPPGGSRA
ncbi:MAG: DUF3189 family protein [Armatimonadota bacterium]|nr:DUF3189 family protein [Armatimonadota bacterium]